VLFLHSFPVIGSAENIEINQELTQFQSIWTASCTAAKVYFLSHQNQKVVYFVLQHEFWIVQVKQQ